ncbi:MAG: hypothetical protein BroJett005_01580 [Ignavibacteriota bacterium]|nr:MAG: hypothetical protein BroJett005_01580 [Ignavibacteriota bacterium]
MKQIVLSALVICLGILFKSCNTTEPPPNGEKPTLELTLEDVSCIEAWIQLKTTNLQLPAEITLKKNNVAQSTILCNGDTLLYIDSLLPNKTYNFIAVVESSEQLDTSNQLQVTTLDTTSHIFSYQTFELGEPLTGNSSILYDVAIVGEEIWAVGEIYMLDSLGQTDPEPYAIAHWDGTDWTLMKVFYRDYGTTQKFAGKLKTIYAFGPDSIYVCSSANLLKWENGDWIEKAFFMISVPFNGQVNKMWGTSGNNLYFAGNSGAVYHFTGQTWQQNSSVTEMPLTDVFGTEQGDVYVTGANISEVKGVLLKGNANQFSVMINAEVIDESQLFQKLYGILGTVWLDEHNTIYTGGSLLFRYKNSEWNYETSLPENFIGGNPGASYRGVISSIRGNASNDYIIAGGRNTLKHFNGVSWEQIGLPYDPQSPIVWRNVKTKNNIVVAVGLKNNSAYIILLNR